MCDMGLERVLPALDGVDDARVGTRATDTTSLEFLDQGGVVETGGRLSFMTLGLDAAGDVVFDSTTAESNISFDEGVVRPFLAYSRTGEVEVRLV